MKPLNPEVVKRVSELWWAGYGYREISKKVGVGMGSIANIIENERTSAPDIEDLRRLKLTLEASRSSLPEALRGAYLLEKWGAQGISLDALDEAVGFYERYREKAAEVLEWGQRLRELEEKRGKGYEEIVKECEEKADELEKLNHHIDELKSEEKRLTKSIRELNELKAIQDKLDKHGLTPSKLDGFMEREYRLDELGFTPKAAEILASELSKFGLSSQQASAQLLSLIHEHEDLETAVAKLQGEKLKLTREIEAVKDELEGLRKQKETLQRQVQDLKELLDTQKKLHAQSLKQQEEEALLKKKRIETEHQRRLQELREKYTQEKESLNKEISTLTAERDKLAKDVENGRSELTALKKSQEELQQNLRDIEEKVKGYKPLYALALIIEGKAKELPQPIILENAISITKALEEYLSTADIAGKYQLSGNLKSILTLLTKETHIAK